LPDAGTDWSRRPIRILVDIDRAPVRFAPRTGRILCKVEPPLQGKEEWLVSLNRPIIVFFPWPRVFRRVLIRYRKDMEDSLSFTFERRFGVKQSYAWVYGVKSMPRDEKRLQEEQLRMLGPADIHPAQSEDY